jgi:hypothetical protein
VILSPAVSLRATTCKKMFISLIVDLLAFYERYNWWGGGEYYAPTSPIRWSNLCSLAATSVEGHIIVHVSTRAYDSVYTVMIEDGQIVSCHFVNAGDLSEIEAILNRVKNRFAVHGFEEVKLFYTDYCCHEYDTLILIRCFDSFARQDENFLQPLKIPPLLKLQCQRKVKTLNTYAELVPVAVEFMEHLDYGASWLVPGGNVGV